MVLDMKISSLSGQPDIITNICDGGGTMEESEGVFLIIQSLFNIMFLDKDISKFEKSIYSLFII